MEDKVMIQVRFRVDTAHGQYNDALYFTQDEYAVTDQATIDTMKQDRVDNWINTVTHPPAYVEPTLTELQTQFLQLDEQIDEVRTKILAKPEVTKEELEAIESNISGDLDEVKTKITEKEAEIIE